MWDKAVSWTHTIKVVNLATSERPRIDIDALLLAGAAPYGVSRKADCADLLAGSLSNEPKLPPKRMSR
jgi:hypothetical protein